MKPTSLRRSRAARLAARTQVDETWILGLLGETDRLKLTQNAVLALLGAKRRGELPLTMTPRQAAEALQRRIAAAAGALATGELEAGLDGPGVRLRHVPQADRAADIGPCDAEVVRDGAALPLVILRPLEPRIVPVEAWAAGTVAFSVRPGEAADLINANACRIRVDTDSGEFALDQPCDLPSLPERTRQ